MRKFKKVYYVEKKADLRGLLEELNQLDYKWLSGDSLSPEDGYTKNFIKKTELPIVINIGEDGKVTFIGAEGEVTEFIFELSRDIVGAEIFHYREQRNGGTKMRKFKKIYYVEKKADLIRLLEELNQLGLTWLSGTSLSLENYYTEWFINRALQLPIAIFTEEEKVSFIQAENEDTKLILDILKRLEGGEVECYRSEEEEE